MKGKAHHLKTTLNLKVHHAVLGKKFESEETDPHWLIFFFFFLPQKKISLFIQLWKKKNKNSCLGLSLNFFTKTT